MLGFLKKKKKDAPAEEADAEGAKPEAAAEGEGGEGEAPVKKKLSGKTLILFIVLPAVLVLGGGGAAAYMLFFKGGGAEQHAEADAGHEHHVPAVRVHGRQSRRWLNPGGDAGGTAGARVP